MIEPVIASEYVKTAPEVGAIVRCRLKLFRLEKKKEMFEGVAVVRQVVPLNGLSRFFVEAVVMLEGPVPKNCEWGIESWEPIPREPVRLAELEFGDSFMLKDPFAGGAPNIYKIIASIGDMRIVTVRTSQESFSDRLRQKTMDANELVYPVPAPWSLD
jgi:hypothetical protein